MARVAESRENSIDFAKLTQFMRILHIYSLHAYAADSGDDSGDDSAAITACPDCQRIQDLRDASGLVCSAAVHGPTVTPNQRAFVFFPSEHCNMVMQ